MIRMSKAPVKTVNATGINVKELREKKLLLERTKKEIDELASRIKNTRKFTFSDANKIIITSEMMKSMVNPMSYSSIRFTPKSVIKKITAQLSNDDDVELIISMEENTE